MSVILSIRGENKTCKSTLGLSAAEVFAPDTLRHYDLDLGFERAAVRFQEEIQKGLIASKRYPTPPQGISINKDGNGNVKVEIRSSKKVSGVRELWEEFFTDYVTALQDNNIATHMVDTASQAWETCHRGYLQERQEAQPANDKPFESLMPVQYGEPNSRMRSLIYAARTYGRNLILTHYEKDVYAGETKTGERELDGFKHTGGLSDMTIYTYLRNPPIDNTPLCKVVLCGLDLRLQGMEIEEPTWEKLMEALKVVRGG